MTNKQQHLSVFNFNGQALTVLDDGNQPWFVAKEVCLALGIVKDRDAISRLDDDERGSVKVDTLGGIQSVNAINESGLYSLTLTSNKPQAKVFKKWITSEVLPTIRKTGSYSLSTKSTATPQDQFYKNHKTACVLFTERLSRLRYANTLTLEQTGVDVLRHAGLYLPDQHPALSTLLNKSVDDKTIQQLLDSVHYQHLDAHNAKTILQGLWLRLHQDKLYIGNPCPLVDDRKAIQAIPNVTKNACVYMNKTATRATIITLY